VLAVDVVRCDLHWNWIDRMNQAHWVPVFAAWLPDAVIGDGAASHRGKLMGALPFKHIALPSYSPELNLPERIFEEIRRAIEGEVYPPCAPSNWRLSIFCASYGPTKHGCGS
jgi:hypothetical protein